MVTGQREMSRLPKSVSVYEPEWFNDIICRMIFIILCHFILYVHKEYLVAMSIRMQSVPRKSICSTEYARTILASFSMLAHNGMTAPTPFFE